MCGFTLGAAAVPASHCSVPTVLAIDTATEYCSIALLRADRVEQRIDRVGQAHSSVLLPWIEAMLREHALRLDECDAIAFGAGPGSFTGLRIACGVAQGLAWGADKPVVAIGNLAAMAWQAAGSSAAPQRVACAIDARMGEAYWAVFEVDGVRVREIVAPTLSASSTLVEELLAHQPDAVAGNALTTFDLRWPDAVPTLLPNVRAHAHAIATLAAQAWAHGAVLAPADARPHYVRDRVAQTLAERMQMRLSSEARP